MIVVTGATAHVERAEPESFLGFLCQSYSPIVMTFQ
jgi:hypothetical protein